MSWPVVLIILIHADGIAPIRSNKHAAGCSARVRCGGKIRGMDTDFICSRALERSEQLSMTIRGLPGPTGLPGLTGNSGRTTATFHIGVVLS